MKSSVTAVLLVVLMGMSTGCVSQQLYDECRAAYLKSQERVAELEAQVAELNEQIRQLQLQGSAGTETALDLAVERDRLKAALAAARAEITRLRARGTALTPELESALQKFADRHANLASYDPITGAVKFKSDLTFALGSAEISDAARQSLAGLAEIFNSPDAAGYEIRVIGHTDNMPIRRAVTKAKHPTNWHLSVHRAIAVREALEAAGVPAVRMAVAGYGPYRPVVANGPRGAADNRRVEIFLAPMTDAETVAPAADEDAGAASDVLTHPEPATADDSEPARPMPSK